MIRLATEKDIDGILLLLEQILAVHHKGRPDLFKGAGTKFTREELAGMIRDRSTYIFVYTDEADRVVAHCFATPKNVPETVNTLPYRTLFLEDVCVLETMRGKHIGSEMLDYVKAYALEQSFDSITLNVWDFNAPAKSFYEKAGLRPQRTIMEWRPEKRD